MVTRAVDVRYFSHEIHKRSILFAVWAGTLFNRRRSIEIDVRDELAGAAVKLKHSGKALMLLDAVRTLLITGCYAGLSAGREVAVTTFRCTLRLLWTP